MLNVSDYIKTTKNKIINARTCILLASNILTGASSGM